MKRLPSMFLSCAAAVAVVAVGHAPPAAAGVEDPQTSTVDERDYPDADRIFQERGIRLLKGNGRMQLAECARGADVIQIWSRTADNPFCFRVTRAPAYLTMELEKAYNVRGDSHANVVKVTVDGETKEVAVPPNQYVGIGEGHDPDSGPATVLELRTAGAEELGSPDEDSSLEFVAKLEIPYVRACSGALIKPQWVITARSCLANAAGDVPAGPPPPGTRVTVGRPDLTRSGGHVLAVVQVVPHPQRNVALVRLATPVRDIVGIPVGPDSLAPKEPLTVAGFGRTHTEWAPEQVHGNAFSVSAVGATTMDLAPHPNPDVNICKGDAGAPAFGRLGVRKVVAIGHTSWQGGCLGESETRRGATLTRVDDLATWINQNTPGG